MRFFNPHVTFYPDVSHQVSIQLDIYNGEFQDSSDGGHNGYRNGTTLRNQNLHVVPMSQIKFQLNICTHGELTHSEPEQLHHENVVVPI